MRRLMLARIDDSPWCQIIPIEPAIARYGLNLDGDK